MKGSERVDRITKNIGLKIAIGLALLVWLFTRSQPARIAAVLQSIPAGFFLLVLSLYLISFVVNAVKWRLLLQGGCLRELFTLVLIGQYYSTFLPGQIAGEAVKYMRYSDGKPDAEKVAASVAFDRITGLYSIFAVTLFGLTASRAGDFMAAFGVYLLLPFALLLSPIFLYKKYLVRFVKKGLLRVLQFRGRSRTILRFAFRFVDACHRYMRQPRLLFIAVIVGLLLHGICIAIVMALGRQLGIFLAYVDWCWIFGLVSLVVFLPITVGGIGLRESGFVVLLGLFSVAPETALAFSLALFAMQLAVALIGGVLELQFHLSTSQRSSSSCSSY